MYVLPGPPFNVRKLRSKRGWKRERLREGVTNTEVYTQTLTFSSIRL